MRGNGSSHAVRSAAPVATQVATPTPGGRAVLRDDSSNRAHVAGAERRGSIQRQPDGVGHGPARVEHELRLLRGFWPAAAVWLAAVLATGWSLGPAAASGGAVATLAAARSAFRARARRSLRRVDEQLPFLIDELARGLRTGASLTQAFAEASEVLPEPIASQARTIATSARHGTVVDALLRWTTVTPTAAVRATAHALLVSIEVGGATAHAVEGVAATQRERAAIDAELRALSSQARMSALVMTVAPLSFCVLLVGSDEAASAFLLRSPLGLACLTVGISLDLLAAKWMLLLTRGRQ